MTKKNYLFFLIILFLFISFIKADTTFFDDENDAFIIPGKSLDSQTVTGIEIFLKRGGRDCKYRWNCTSWNKCLSSEKQIRECINIGTCPDEYKAPELEQKCVYAEPEIKEKLPIKKGKGNILIWILVSVLISLIALKIYMKHKRFKRYGY